MAVIVSMLRGVNVAGHNKIKMEVLRALYESLGFRDAQTYVASGNVVFRTEAQSLTALAKRIESAIERDFGFRPCIILAPLPNSKIRSQETHSEPGAVSSRASFW